MIVSRHGLRRRGGVVLVLGRLEIVHPDLPGGQSLDPCGNPQ